MSEGSFGHGGGDASFYGRQIGPYGTNEGDIWSGEDSEVGQRLLKEEGLVLIHEVLRKDDKVEERIYCVEQNNPKMEMQDLIKRAREGTAKWVAAQAANN